MVDLDVKYIVPSANILKYTYKPSKHRSNPDSCVETAVSIKSVGTNALPNKSEITIIQLFNESKK